MPRTSSRDLTDAQWETLDKRIPETPRRKDRGGRPWKNRRAVLNDILWVLWTGVSWADVPDRYTSFQTRHRRFQQWVRSGIMMRGVLEALAIELRVRGGLNVKEGFNRRELCSSEKGGSKVGKTKRSKRTKITCKVLFSGERQQRPLSRSLPRSVVSGSNGVWA